MTEREDLQDAFIHRIVEGMDYKDLVSYAHEMLADYYDRLLRNSIINILTEK